MPKVVVVALDSLMPSAVTDNSMPNLRAAYALGTLHTNHRAVVPTETYVNIASLITGRKVHEHGVVANRFLDRSKPGSTAVNLGAAAEIDAWVDRNGRLIQTQTLGEYLGQSGKKLAVVSSGSSGIARVLDPQGKALGHFSFSCHAPAYSYPQPDVAQILSRFGSCPPRGQPDLEAMRYAVDVFLGYVATEIDPDVGILWLNEPDESYHAFGSGGASVSATLAAADEQFGRVLRWWKENADETCSLFVVSDHGHITLQPSSSIRDDLVEILGEGYGKDGSDGRYVRFSRFSLIYLCEQELGHLDSYVQKLLEKPWIGHVFCKSAEGAVPPGAFPISILMGANPRCPDIAFTTQTHPRAGGTAVADYDLGATEAGSHGGLEADELQCLFLAIGPQHPQGHVHRDPTTVDCVFDALIAAVAEKTSSVADQGRNATFELSTSFARRSSVVWGTFDGSHHNVTGGRIDL